MNPELLADSSAVRWAPTRRWGDDERSQAIEAATPLPTGTCLHEFELLGVLGSGGFGTVYLARDAALLRDVAIKEYLPVEFACRSADGQVRPRSAAEASSYATGLRSFIQEARLLAGFEHPSLVKVHRFWEGNGTAYMAMPHYRGRTLKEVRQAMAGNADETMLRALLEPLLSALAVLHDASVCHRDVSPDNIVLQPDGVPVLLDFGCAREVVHDRTQALTAVFKPNFAAIEQYGDDPGLRQGAWTDLYALAGVLRYMILGAPPPPAAMRAVKDSMVPLADSADDLPGLSPAFLRAIDWALQLDPEQRPQSVAAWREAFDAPEGAALYVPGAALQSAGAEASATSGVQHARRSRFPTWSWAAMLGIALTLGVGVWAAAELRAGAAAKAASLQSDQPAVARQDAPVAIGPVAAEAAHVELPPVAKTVAAPDRDRRPAASAPDARRAAASRTEPTVSRSVPAAPSKPTAPAAEHDVAGAVPSPRQACGPRNFFAMAICMDRRCREPRYRSHAECEAYIRYADARRQAEENR